MAEKHRFIEFIGMPGSGKTFLSHSAAVLVRQSGFIINEPTYHINHRVSKIRRQMLKCWYSARVIMLTPHWAFQWFMMVVTSGQKTMRDFIKMIVNVFHILEILRVNGKKAGTTIFDQGILQALWSLSYNARFMTPLRNIKDLREILPSEYHVLYISVDRDTFIRRLKLRKKRQSRLERDVINNRINETALDAERKMHRLVESIESDYPNIDLQKVNNDAEADSIAAVACILQKILKGEVPG